MAIRPPGARSVASRAKYSGWFSLQPAASERPAAAARRDALVRHLIRSGYRGNGGSDNAGAGLRPVEARQWGTDVFASPFALHLPG